MRNFTNENLSHDMVHLKKRVFLFQGVGFQKVEGKYCSVVADGCSNSKGYSKRPKLNYIRLHQHATLERLGDRDRSTIMPGLPICTSCTAYCAKQEQEYELQQSVRYEHVVKLSMFAHLD